jgi:hypothetical protein
MTDGNQRAIPQATLDVIGENTCDAKAERREESVGLPTARIELRPAFAH